MGERWFLRLLGFLVAVALPPLVAFAIADVVAGDLIARYGMGTTLTVAAAVTVLWAAVVAVGGSRILGAEADQMIAIAQHGRPADAGAEEGGAQERLAVALDERNRQIAELAASSRAAPITEDAAAVARSMVGAARTVTGDPTWSLAILRSDDDALLPPGVYGVERDLPPGEIEEVHRWASTVDPPHDPAVGAQLATGPWGAFVTADVAGAAELRAILVAPWEGRAAPSRAELELLSLLGQHAGAAIEHALLYERVRTQAAEINRMASVQADFLRGVSHDLQTPLTSIRALADEVRSAAALDESARHDLETIAHQADRLRRMVAQLLVASRLEAGAITPRSDVFRVEPLVERTWNALRVDRPFSLRTDGAGHLAVGDPDRFEQVMWALLDNATKYSPDGSAIDVVVEPLPGPRLSVTVTDHGRGMSPETQAHAFEQFYRAADARSAAPDGSGIGLYTARGLIGAMGGTVSVTSSLGAGTSIALVLPAELAHDDPAAEA
jgi:signal transduction histidine kinase